MNYIYLVDKNNYVILDTGGCNRSKRTIDIHVFDLANNKEILKELDLVYFDKLFSNDFHKYTFDQTADLFCVYLANFERGPEFNSRLDFLLTNPKIRILIENKQLLTKIKNITDGMAN